MKTIEGIVTQTGNFFQTQQSNFAYNFIIMAFEKNTDDQELSSVVRFYEIVEYGINALVTKKMLRKHSKCKVVGQHKKIVVKDSNGQERIVNQIIAESVDYY